jgi:hypothetical protein
VAGDWIKLEKCSPDKPEVMRLARLWGVPKDQAFGAIVRFWIWLDNASVDGVVDGVGSHEVDDMMRVAGFATGLQSVKWLDIDDSVPRIRVPNFGKHTSESAKKRALSNDRQANWRKKSDAHVDAGVDVQSVTKTSTREEKRREDKPKTSAPAKVAVAPPPGVEPENWTAWLRHKGKKQTEDADRIQRKHIAQWLADGLDVNRIVEDAVAGKWQGLHPPDRKPVNGKNGHGGAWWDSEQGVMAKGKELDMTAYPGEEMPAFKARINQRLNAQRGAR